jgi:hypothetical protein
MTTIGLSLHYFEGHTEQGPGTSADTYSLQTVLACGPALYIGGRKMVFFLRNELDTKGRGGPTVSVPL